MIFLQIFFALLTSIHCQKVVDLGDNFDYKLKNLRQDQSLFVKFYAPWCGHCKRLSPIWLQLAEKYNSGNEISIASVNCDEHKSVCSSNEVQGYPTLKLYKGDDEIPYRGGRDYDDFVNFLDKVQEAPVKEITSSSEYLDVNSVQFIIYSNPDSPASFSQIQTHFQNFALKYYLTASDITFLSIPDAQTTKLTVSRIDSTSETVLFRAEDSSSENKFFEKLSVYALPHWNDLTASNYMNVIRNPFRKTDWLVMCLHCEQSKTLKSLALDEKFTGKFVFGKTDKMVLEYLTYLTVLYSH